MTVELISPIALEVGQRFAIREGGRTIRCRRHHHHHRVTRHQQEWERVRSWGSACTECKQRNYSTRKNRKNDPNRIELLKYCPRERRHTLHREAK